MNENQNPTSLKQMIQGMMPDGPGVLEGTVTNESPLQIKLANDAKMVLSQNSLILPDWLTDMEKTIDISLGGGNIIAQTGHEDYLENFDIHGATIVIYNHLKVGEVVLLLSFNGGKQYYILDRRG